MEDLHGIIIGSGDSIKQVKAKYVKNSKSEQLPNELICSPNNYRIGQMNMNLNQEGLVRLISHKKKQTIQRIIFKNNYDLLFRSISNLFIHSSYQNKIKNKNIIKHLLHGRLNCKCGTASRAAQIILDKLENVNFRQIQLMKSPPFDGVSDGHTLSEIKIKNRNWCLYDFDLKYKFVDINDNSTGLSLIDVLDGKKIKLHKMGNYSSNGIKRSIINQRFRFDDGFVDFFGMNNIEELALEFYRKVSNHGGILYKDKWNFYGNNKVIDSFSNNYTSMSKNIFLNKFY